MKTATKNENFTLISKKGIKELKKSIAQLQHDKQKILQDLREIDRKLGHDEQLLQTEKLAELENINTEIEEKDALLSVARPIPRKRSQLEVMLGSVVDLIDRHGHKFRYTLVDSVEADPAVGKISTKSPIGQSLIGHGTHDIIKWDSKDRTYRLRLLRIS